MLTDKVLQRKFMNIKNNKGNTILHKAVLANRQSIYGVLKLKADYLQLDVNAKNKEGFTAEQLLNK